jgi:hypothetical protein
MREWMKVGKTEPGVIAVSRHLVSEAYGHVVIAILRIVHQSGTTPGEIIVNLIVVVQEAQT